MPIDIFNPLRYMDQDEYAEFWINLFNTILFGVRQRNPTVAAICLLLAALIAYGGGIMDMFRHLSG
jgi:hypothetical protein